MAAGKAVPFIAPVLTSGTPHTGVAVGYRRYTVALSGAACAAFRLRGRACLFEHELFSDKRNKNALWTQLLETIGENHRIFIVETDRCIRPIRVHLRNGSSEVWGVTSIAVMSHSRLLSAANNFNTPFHSSDSHEITSAGTKGASTRSDALPISPTPSSALSAKPPYPLAADHRPVSRYST